MHIYYRCTKKKASCAEKYVREENLTDQLKNIMQKVSLPDDWADNMLNELNKEKTTTAQSSIALINSLNEEIKTIENKLDNLLDSHLENIIDKNDYLRKKAELINKKVGLEEKIKRINDQGDNWLEPMRDFILRSKLAKKTADKGDLSQFKAFLKNIGSNFILQGGKFEFLAEFEWNLALSIKDYPCWLPVKKISELSRSFCRI